MKRIAIALATLAVLAGAGCPAKQPEAPRVLTPTEVVDAARATIDQWREAYERRNLEELSKLYTHDLDLVVIHEGVALLGWSSVEAALKDRLARSPSIRIRLKDIQVASLAPDVATGIATMTRELSDGTTTITENGTLSLVLRKIGDRWMIAVEHYSYKRS